MTKRQHKLHGLHRSSLLCCGVAVWTLFVCGCGTSYYRNYADRGAYHVVQQTQRRVLGTTNAFTIETAYSDRKPSEISSAELIGSRSRTNERALTIEQAVEIAIANSREYQTAKETLYAAALRLSTARYNAGHVAASVDAGASYERESSGAESSDAVVDTGATITRLFASGGRLTADLLNSIMLYYSGKPELSFSRISASLTQPLLRGFGKNSPEVEALTQAERNMVYAVRAFRLYQDQFALDTVNDYFRLLQLKDGIRNNYTNYLRRVDSTRRLESRADRETKNAVDQARQAELSARNTYVNTIADFKNTLDQFKITLGLPLGERIYLDDSAFEQVKGTGLVPAPLDTELAYRLAIERQPQILNYIDQFEDSKRRVRIAADQLKPGLTIGASARLESEDNNDYTHFNGNDVAANVGVLFNLPLDPTRLGNTYRSELIAFEASLRVFTRRLDDLKSSIESGVRTLEQRRQNYIIQKNALQLANERVANTTMLQQAGRVEVRDLNDSLDSLVLAENQVTAALINYQQSRLQLMLAIGALNTEQPDFWLKDHIATFLPAGTPPAPSTETASTEPVPTPEEAIRN